MRKIIGGKVYDTEKAALICGVGANGFHRGDFQWEDTGLYKTAKGAFFLAGEGGPLSRWAQPEGQNGRRSGSGVIVLSVDEAKEHCERYGTAEDFEEAFGEPEEG